MSLISVGTSAFAYALGAAGCLCEVVGTPLHSGATVQVFMLSSYRCTMSDTELSPKLRIAFACRSVPPSGGRRKLTPPAPEPPKLHRWRKLVYAAILPLLVTTLSFSAAPAMAVCPPGATTCIPGPDPTQGPQPTQGGVPTTAPGAPQTTVPGYTPPDTPSAPTQGNGGFQGTVMPMPTPDDVDPNSCIMNCTPTQAPTVTQAPTTAQQPPTTGQSPPTTGAQTNNRATSVSEPPRNSTSDCRVNSNPVTVNASGPMADDIKAAVNVWRALGAKIEVVDGPANTSIAFAPSNDIWDGEYVPLSRAIQVNTSRAVSSTQRVRVLVHELGHALGLADGVTPFMSGAVDAPTADDISAIAALPTCGTGTRGGDPQFCLVKYENGGCVGGSIVGGDKGIPEVKVPDDYIYDPKCEQLQSSGQSCFAYSLKHDYCSGSPDQFPSLGANANFSGPCARHDMCLDGYGTKQTGKTGKDLWTFCNGQLYSDLVQNCRFMYGLADPRLAVCTETARVYWDIVTANGIYDILFGAPK